jgi:hypothetical protein
MYVSLFYKYRVTEHNSRSADNERATTAVPKKIVAEDDYDLMDA